MKGLMIFLLLFVLGMGVLMLFVNFWDSSPEESVVVGNVSLVPVRLLFEPESVDFSFSYFSNFSNVSGRGFNKPGVVDIVSLPRESVRFVLEYEGFYDYEKVCDIYSSEECFFVPERVGVVSLFYSNVTKNLRLLVDGGVVGGGLLCVGYRDFNSFNINFTKVVPPKAYSSDYDFCSELVNLTPGFYDWVVEGVGVNGEFWLLFDFLDSSESSIINNFKY